MSERRPLQEFYETDCLSTVKPPFLNEDKLSEGILEGVIPISTYEGTYNLILSISQKEKRAISETLDFTFVEQDQMWSDPTLPVIAQVSYSDTGKLVKATMGKLFGNMSSTSGEDSTYTLHGKDEQGIYNYRSTNKNLPDQVHVIEDVLIISLDHRNEEYRKALYAPLTLPPTLLSACRALSTHGKEAAEYLDVFQDQHVLRLSYQLKKYLPPIQNRYTLKDTVLVSWWKNGDTEIKLERPSEEVDNPRRIPPLDECWIFDKSRK